MKQAFKTSQKASQRALFLRERLCFTPKKRKKPSKTPPAVDYRGIFRQKKYAVKEPDPETGLYYYGARYLDPKTSRWISGDPALGEYLPSAPLGEEAKRRNGSLPGQGGVFNYVNLHVYHYAGNNPVKYVDPDGRIDEEEQATAMQQYLDEAWKSTTFGPDPDSFVNQPSISDKIEAYAKVNLNQIYGSGNQCDDWVEKVLTEAGVDPLEYFAGEASLTSVQQHIDNVINNGTNVTNPGEGAYVVFMNESPRNFNPHAAILIVDKHGGATIYHQSRDENGLSRQERYSSGVNSFQTAFAYRKFYYQKIQ